MWGSLALFTKLWKFIDVCQVLCARPGMSLPCTCGYLVLPVCLTWCVQKVDAGGLKTMIEINLKDISEYL